MAKRDPRDIPTTEQLRSELARLRYRKNFADVFRNTFSTIITAAAVITLIAVFVFPVLRVSGQSMQPTLSNDELILCSKATTPERGDIIAFYYNKKILLKRVIAVGGDVIEIGADGSVRVNDTLLDEPYVEQPSLGECDIVFPYTVPHTRYFVLGDNRAESVDSRSAVIGCIPQEDVIGTIYMVIWPFDQMKSLS